MSKKNVSKSIKMPPVHTDRGYDCVYVKRKKIMLGKSGSPEAEAAYRQLQVKILTDPTFSASKPQQVSVDDLCFAYLQYAQEHDPSHYASIKTAANILIQHYAGQAVDTLDTRHFLFLQDKFVEHGVSRQYCNSLMSHIRAMLKWGILRKLVSHQVYVEAKFIPPLKKGKTKARENPKRQDVLDEVVNRTLTKSNAVPEPFPFMPSISYPHCLGQVVIRGTFIPCRCPTHFGTVIVELDA